MAVPRVRRVEKKPSVSEDTSIWFGRHVMLFAENTSDVVREERIPSILMSQFNWKLTTATGSDAALTLAERRITARPTQCGRLAVLLHDDAGARANFDSHSTVVAARSERRPIRQECRSFV